MPKMRSKADLPDQALRALQAAFHLAQEVEEGLDRSEVLLGAMSRGRAADAAARDVVTTLRIVLGDQLSHAIAALEQLDPARDVVLMMEVMQENTYVQHHKQKIVLVLSAMRHFAQELRQNGFQVDYVRLDEPGNTGDLTASRACGRPPCAPIA